MPSAGTPALTANYKYKYKYLCKYPPQTGQTAAAPAPRAPAVAPTRITQAWMWKSISDLIKNTVGAFALASAVKLWIASHPEDLPAHNLMSATVAIASMVWLMAGAAQFAFEVDERRTKRSRAWTSITIAALILFLNGGFYLYLHFTIPDRAQKQFEGWSSCELTQKVIAPVHPHPAGPTSGNAADEPAPMSTAYWCTIRLQSEK